MTAFRTKKQESLYEKYQKGTLKEECPFCGAHIDEQHIIQTTKHFYVMKNLFPYAVWDRRKVEAHLMIVPKRHIPSLRDFSAAEWKEYDEITAQYEVSGYNLYTRSMSATARSVWHQHTHLIKTKKSEIKYLLFSNRRPFIRLLK